MFIRMNIQIQAFIVGKFSVFNVIIPFVPPLLRIVIYSGFYLTFFTVFIIYSSPGKVLTVQFVQCSTTLIIAAPPDFFRSLLFFLTLFYFKISFICKHERRFVRETTLKTRRVKQRSRTLSGMLMKFTIQLKVCSFGIELSLVQRLQELANFCMYFYSFPT